MLTTYGAAPLSALQPGFLPPLLPGAAPEQAEHFDAIMSDFVSKLLPGVLHWQSPRFFAYFNANSRHGRYGLQWLAVLGTACSVFLVANCSCAQMNHLHLQLPWHAC
jgi:hypothetical protein